jgi:hypothetical protein
MIFHKAAILAATSVVLLVGAVTSHGFDFNYNSSGNAAHWTFNPPDPGISTNVFDRNNHAIRFYIASDGFSTTNTAAELNAVRNCFGQWQSVPNTVVKYEDAGLVAPGYDVNTSDDTNVVYWAKTSTVVNGGMSDITGALAVTFMSFSVPGNEILQFDIVINGVEQSWFTDFNDSNNTNYFVEGSLTHEIGHSLGLSHAAIGGATMLYAGQTGVDTQAGLSVDEVAYARTLYPSGSILSTLGNLKGTVTKSGSPVFGAAVILEGTNGNLAGGTVTLANGTYILNSVPPGNYYVRVWPLDDAAAFNWLIQGQDISSSFSGADTSFLPTGNTAVTLSAGTTNTLNFTVTNGTPAFRITLIRTPVTDPGNYAIIGLPTTMSPGQSNYTIGVFSADLPITGATFTITGDGLTLGSPTFDPGTIFSGLNGISMSISVASNATPGLRTFIVQQGGNVAYANGFLEILPLIPDYNFDGLDDRFQRKYFFPFTSTNAAPNADPDGDGFVNYAEYVAGTDPTNPASFLKLLSTTTASNGTTVVWQSVAGKHYQLMSRTDLGSGTWQNVGSPVTANGATAQLLDGSATNGARFYKVQVFP